MKDFNKLQVEYWNDQSQRERRDPRHAVIKTYVEPKLKFISNFINLETNSQVLDVGAGNGYFSYYFDQIADVTAVDYSPVILEQNPVQKKLVMDARHLELPDQSFDLVFCHALLHHVHKGERLQVIREMKRVSKKYVVIIEPNRNNPLMAAFGLVKKEERGSLDFSLSYCRVLVQQAGLKIVRATSFGLLTPNRMPIPLGLLPLIRRITERPLWGGISNLVIAGK